MTRNSISSPTLSFVETAVYELQKQMHEKRLELVEAGKAEPAKHESGEANHWHEDFRADMPDKNIVIPYCEAFDGQEKPDFCLLYVPEHSKIIMGTLEFTDPEKADAANNLLDKIGPVAERVIAGYDERWDGNNHVATFTDDAQAAIEEIEALCDIEEHENNCVTEWDAEDWLQNVMCRRDIDGHPTQWDHAVKTVISDYGTITHETTDDQLSEIEEKIEADADDNVVINNLSKWLTEERDNCKQNWEYLQN